jgi:tungstate transport system ATP-binding protein
VEHLLRTPPQKLSGGERQRVALARARVLDARILLFDEPTANLDQESRQQIVTLLERAHSENNCVLVACHDREIIRLSHVTRLHLEAGKILLESARKNAAPRDGALS